MTAPEFPYPTESDDHCETPLSAYADVAPLLKKIAATMKMGTSDIRIYDPYYCDNAVARNLNDLGFTNVYNKKEDCYHVWDNRKRCPSYDILLTNPPYSGSHIEKLMKHLASSDTHGNRCWFLLLPNWVHKKPYFQAACAGMRPFFVVPRKRYIYIPPVSFREARKSDVQKKTSPWPSMWYVWGGTLALNEVLIREFYRSESKNTCSLARSNSALRDLRRRPNS